MILGLVFWLPIKIVTHYLQPVISMVDNLNNIEADLEEVFDRYEESVGL